MNKMAFLPVFWRSIPLSLLQCLLSCVTFDLKNKTFPSSCKHALIQPILKKGSISNPSNYCPIAFSSGISKAVESFFNSHFLNLESQYSLWSPVWFFAKQDPLVISFPILRMSGYPQLTGGGGLNHCFTLKCDTYKRTHPPRTIIKHMRLVGACSQD